MAIPGLSPSSTQSLRDAVRARESSGNYRKENSQGYIGGYQFGAAALQDLGQVIAGTYNPSQTNAANNAKLNNNNVWTTPGGKQAFLNDPQRQDRTFDQYATRNVKTLNRAGVIATDTPQGDIGGYVAASHIGGAGGARDLANGKIRQDANGTTTAQYFSLGKTAVTKAQSSPQSPSVTDADRAEAQRIQEESGDPDAITAEQVAANRSVSNSLSTAGIAAERSPNTARPAFRSATSDGTIGEAEAIQYRKNQAQKADEYGTDIDSQQTRILQEQDSWFSATENKGSPGSTAGVVSNPLAKFVSYTYRITLGCIPPEFLETPLDAYGTVIMQSGNGPDNRQQIAGGDFDFYFDALDVESLIGLNNIGNGTNVTTINFEVIEPYSLGLFLESLQVAANVISKDQNYSNAVYVLTVEFVGWDDNGKFLELPEATRRIAIRLTNVDMNIDGRGTRYKIDAIPWAEYGLSDQFNKLSSDLSFSFNKDGPYTLGDLLTNAESSLQNVINLRYKETAAANNRAGGGAIPPDEIVIKFPDDATEIAASLIKFDMQTGGNTGDIKVSDVIVDGTVRQSKLKFNPLNRRFQFKQGTTIVSVLTEVMHHTEYCKKSAASKKNAQTGMMDWFRIETEVAPSSTETGRGRPPYKITFRIVKYRVHSSAFAHPTVKQDYSSVQSNVVKEYNYIYTGKNTEVLNFNINLKYSFATTRSADNQLLDGNSVNATQIHNAGSNNPSSTAGPAVQIDPQAPAPNSEKALPQAISGNSIGRRGAVGGILGPDELTRLSRQFHAALLDSDIEMVSAEIEIIGDPYYLTNAGNYSEANSGSFNQTSSGAMDYQSGEVDVLFNFRTPVDINPTTGLVDFGDSQIAKGFSGLYRIIRVTNSFKQGKFIQTLHALRRPRQSEGATAISSISQIPLSASYDPTARSA